MSGRMSDCDSGEPDLWSNGSVFMGLIEPISLDPSPHILLQQTTDKFTDDIRRWVEEDKSDEWIASALGTSSSSVQSFRSRNAIYRRHATSSTLHNPKDYSSYEGVLEPEGPGIWLDPEVGKDPRWQKRWKSTQRVQLRLTSTRIILLRLVCIAECLNGFEYLIQ